MNRTQTIIRRIEDELKALKIATPLNYGALKFPDSTPTETQTWTINTSNPGYIIARIAATFTRTDGEPTTPLVDFAFDYSVSPNYVEASAQQGVTITGSDPNALEEFAVDGYEAVTTNTSVTYYIDVNFNILTYATTNITLNTTVQAISPVEGTLTLERIK